MILLGNLGKDPEIRNLERGGKVANFPLATNRVYRGQDQQKVEETEWHNIVLWGNLADLAEKFLSKGRQVFIEGRIRTRSWDDKDGIKRYMTEIVGENMTFVGGRDESERPRPPAGNDYQKGTAAEAEQSVEDDDLPF